MYGMACTVSGAQSRASARVDVLERVLRNAEAAPGDLAVRDDHEEFSYGELAERAAATASGLAGLGVAPGDRVAIDMGNSAGFVTTALGCLWLGAPFVPLSPRDPPGRIARIVADCQPTVIVSSPAGAGAREFVTLPTVGVEDLLNQAGPVPARSVDAERDAYLIYTSGTTGAPKGVRIPERAFGWAVANAAMLFGLDRSTRALCVSSFHFDGSYGTVFPTLLAGGSLVIPKRENLLFLKQFYRAVQEEEITFTGFSPSYLRLLVASHQLKRLAGSELNTVALGGEECAAGDVGELWSVLPELKVFNRYGPTETTIAVTNYEVSADDVASGRIPIGAPHVGVSFYLLRPDGTAGAIAGEGEVGELYIGGEQLMRGYWGDFQLSETVLRRDVVPGELVYKTGDLVYRDERGLYVYVGRSDDVVKRNGVRISLDEVTYALRRVDGVAGAVCLAIDLGGRLGIVAFVEAQPDMTAGKLLDATSSDLPATMRPDEVFIVSALPMTNSGKVDRPRLLEEAGRTRWGDG
jgi:D-alanine--poly(phosphoribitol) ligase subunit 1